jgi:hypothetical protein
MQEIIVPPDFVISSYEKAGRFVLLFASPASPNPATDQETIAITMTPQTLNALADYFQESDD